MVGLTDEEKEKIFNSSSKQDAMEGAKELGQTSFSDLAKKAYNNPLVEAAANLTGLSWNTSVTAKAGSGGLMDGFDPMFDGKVSDKPGPDAKMDDKKDDGATVSPMGADDPTAVLSGAPRPGGK